MGNTWSIKDLEHANCIILNYYGRNMNIINLILDPIKIKKYYPKDIKLDINKLDNGNITECIEILNEIYWFKITNDNADLLYYLKKNQKNNYLQKLEQIMKKIRHKIYNKVNATNNKKFLLESLYYKLYTNLKNYEKHVEGI